MKFSKMNGTCRWFLILAIVSACTCGGRTECGKKGQISLLTAIHDDQACERVTNRGVMTYEAVKYLIELHNNNTGNFKLDVTVLDTCGSISGAIKATMKSLVWSDMNCLRPPFYLGMIGPYSILNIDAVQKITSILNIPHIVKEKVISPYLHHLSKETDSSIIQAILEVITALRWKSFAIITSSYGNHENDIQHIAKKVTMSGIAKGFCIMIYDEDQKDFGNHILHIGKPNEKIFEITNATILIASEGHLRNYINQYNALSNIFLLEDPRNKFVGLESRVENSKWWNGNEGIGKYDFEELRDIRWLEDAIGIYKEAFETLCAKHQCSEQVNPAEWNNIISNILAGRLTKSHTTTRTLEFSLKEPSNTFEKLGDVVIRNKHAKIHWRSNENVDAALNSNDIGNEKGEYRLDSMEEVIPESFKNILSYEREKQSDRCATTVKDISDDDTEVSKILFAGIDDHEWWTMLATVGGVGVSMFAVGIFAVYIVITNIRGPRTPKTKSVRSVERDVSMRRVQSEQDLQVVTERPQRPQRAHRENPRCDSTRSIRSDISDRSV